MSGKPKGPVGGILEVARMLQHLSEPERDKLLVSIARKDPKLAARILGKMFTFEDLRFEDPKRVQKLLRGVPMTRLALAMRGASEELRDFIFSNMAQRPAQDLRELIESTPPQKRSEVEKAQSEILGVFKPAGASPDRA